MKAHSCVLRFVTCVTRATGIFLILFLSMTYDAGLTGAFAAKSLLIDDFEDKTNRNVMGGNSNTYASAPSRALALLRAGQGLDESQVLLVRYDKRNSGGPYGKGGWCGYYTLVKTGNQYLNASTYLNLTFWVRGDKGGENFMVGVADRHWDEVGDSVKSEAIGKYLPSGKVTAEWQKATLPLSVFAVNPTELASVALCFEGDAFPAGAGKGAVYIDNVMLE